MAAWRRDAPPRMRPRWRPCPAVMSSTIALVSPWRREPNTIASSVHSISFTSLDESPLRKLQSYRAIALRVVLPVLAHLHVQEQVHRLLDGGGDLLARLH